MTEYEVQLWLYYTYGQRRLYSASNLYYFENESDFITLTKAGYIDEYEIKLSRADYQNDKKKPRWEKYRHRSPWNYSKAHMYDRSAEPIKVPFKTGKGYSLKYPEIEAYNIWPGARYPNRFHYIVPTDLITTDELPEYAGLIYIHDLGCRCKLTEVKAAPLLHRNKCSDKDVVEILHKLHFRYWSFRINTHAAS